MNNTVEPWYNEGQRDQQNVFAITKFCCIVVLFHMFNCCWDDDLLSLIPRILLYINMYIQKPMWVSGTSYRGSLNQDPNTVEVLVSSQPTCRSLDPGHTLRKKCPAQHFITSKASGCISEVLALCILLSSLHIYTRYSGTSILRSHWGSAKSCSLKQSFFSYIFL